MLEENEFRDDLIARIFEQRWMEDRVILDLLNQAQCLDPDSRPLPFKRKTNIVCVRLPKFISFLRL
jgi:hypothetical protein